MSGLEVSRFVRSLGALAAVSFLGGCDDCPGGYFPPEYVVSVEDEATGEKICDAALEMEVEEPGELVLVNEGRTSCGFRTEAVHAVKNQSRTTELRASREGYETATVTIVNDFAKDDCDHVVPLTVNVELTPVE